MNRFIEFLKGGDLRSIGGANEVVKMVTNQTIFDALFEKVHHNDRKVVMRAMDAIEKITLNAPHFLHAHKAAIWSLLRPLKT